MDNATPYKPSGFYFRAALRSATSREEAIAVGLHVVAELEQLKMWVREHGLIPPKWHLTRSEIEEKRWGEIALFPTSAESSPGSDAAAPA